MMAFCLSLWLYSADVFIEYKILHRFFGIFLFLSLAFLANSAVRYFWWYLFLERSLKMHVPKLFRDFFAIIFYFVAILFIIDVVFGKSISALLAASGVMGLIIGMAIQNIINDLFSGITLNLDSNFHFGDSLTLIDPNQKGKLREVTWRSTRIETADNTLLIVPNSLIATRVITISARQRVGRNDVLIILNASIPFNRAMNIILTALRSTPGILARPVPYVRISRFNADGVNYKCYFWIDNLKSTISQVKHDVMARILAYFPIAGLSLNPDNIAKDPAESVLGFSKIFSCLYPEERSELAKNMVAYSFRPSTKLFEEGAEGDSMFLVAEGTLGVYIKSRGKSDLLRLANLNPGDFFGELSLLSGAPRSATIIAKTECLLYEIKKPILLELISKRPEIVEQLSKIIAKHQIENEKIVAEDTATKEAKIQNYAQDLYKRIKGFLNL